MHAAGVTSVGVWVIGWLFWVMGSFRLGISTPRDCAPNCFQHFLNFPHRVGSGSHDGVGIEVPNTGLQLVHSATPKTPQDRFVP
jgi:hypothetical protein